MAIPSDPLTFLHGRLTDAANEAAKKEGVSTRDWVASAIAEKLARDERLDAIITLFGQISGRKDATDTALIRLAEVVRKHTEATKPQARRFGVPIPALPTT